MLRTARLWGWAVVACAGVAALGVGAALAQDPMPMEESVLPPPPSIKFDYKFDTVPPSVAGDTPMARKTLGDMRKIVTDILRDSEPLAPNQSRFDNFFKLYMFARMTGPDDVPYLPERRREFLKFFTIIKTQATRDHLNNLTLKEMMRVAAQQDKIEDNYHPAARYNAILIIGELNDAEAILNGLEKFAPDPMRAALGTLVTVMTDPKMPDGLKVAALIGIQRHIELDQFRPQDRKMTEPQRNLLINHLHDVAVAPVPTGTPFADGKYWVKRQAVAMLGMLGSVGPANKVLISLEKIAGDTTVPVSFRCAAAVALGQLTYPANPGIDVKLASGKITSIALTACRDEVVRVKERLDLEKARLEKAGAIPGAPGFEGGPRLAPPPPPRGEVPGGPLGVGAVPPGGPPQPVKEDPTQLTRRRLRTQVFAVYTGLVGRAGDKGMLALAKTPDDKAKVTKFVDNIKAILVALEGPGDDLEALRLDLMKKSTELEALLLTVVKPVAPPPAATTPMAAPVEDPTGVP